MLNIPTLRTLTGIIPVLTSPSTATTTTMCKQIIITGGSGKAGKHIIEYLLSKGHEVLNIDIVPLTGPLSNKVRTLKVDLTQKDQVYTALLSRYKLSEPIRWSPSRIPDAIIHIAAIPRSELVDDGETFRVNSLATTNVLDAACRLSIKKIIIASSIAVYNVGKEDEVEWGSFPLTEDKDVLPMDSWALSNLCRERIAMSFVERFKVDIYVFRLGRIVEPHEYRGDMFRSFVKGPRRWIGDGWSYTDARDLGQMCERGVFASGLGFQVFNATNDEITNFAASTEEFLKEMCPRVPRTREIVGREAPVSNAKIRGLLGFVQEHAWQEYYG